MTNRKKNTRISRPKQVAITKRHHKNLQQASLIYGVAMYKIVDVILAEVLNDKESLELACIKAGGEK